MTIFFLSLWGIIGIIGISSSLFIFYIAIYFLIRLNFPISVNFSILFFITFQDIFLFFFRIGSFTDPSCAHVRTVNEMKVSKSYSASDFRSQREPWTFSISNAHTVPRSKTCTFSMLYTVVNLVGDARLINNPAGRTHAPWPSIILIGARYYQAPVRGSLPQRKTKLEFPVNLERSDKR